MAAPDGRADEDDEEVDGIPLSLADALLVAPTTGFEYSFDVGRLTCEDSPSFEIIGVSCEGNKFLVALPFSAWHRRAAQTRLPPGSLTRAQAAEVSACGLSREEASPEVKLKVWLGFLKAELVALVDFPAEGEECEQCFLSMTGMQCPRMLRLW